MNAEGIDVYGVSSAREKIKRILLDLRMQNYSSVKPFSIGYVEERMRVFAKQNSITIAPSLYMSAHAIAHAKRASKVNRGDAVHDRDLIDFPIERKRMDLYYDGENFVYTNYVNKFIVHPNYNLKIDRRKEKVVNFITASKVTDANEFRTRKYTKIR